MAGLRAKIELDPEQPRFLKTVHGVGYKMELPGKTKGNTRLANPARQHASTPRVSDEELKLVAVKLQALRDHLASVEKRLLEGQDALTRYQSVPSSLRLSQAIAQFPDSNLSKLQDQKFDAEQRLAALSTDFGDNHPDRIRAQTVLKTVLNQIHERLDEVLISRQRLLEADARRRNQLQEEILQSAHQLEKSTRKNAATATFYGEVQGMVKVPPGERVISPNAVLYTDALGERPVMVLGHVVRRGPIPFKEGMTAGDAVAAAGGPDKMAKLQGARIDRLNRTSNQTTNLPVNLDSVIVGGRREQDVLLQPGDNVFVPERVL